VSTVRTETAGLTSLPAAAAEMPSGRTVGWWGMVLFITTEAALFAALFASYFYLRFANPGPWPPPGIQPPDLVSPLIMTGLLLASGAPMSLANRQIRRGRVGWAVLGLLATFALGSAFLALGSVDFADKLSTFSMKSNAYGTLYYSISGLHDFHVLVGVLMLVFLLVGVARSQYGPKRYERVRLVALYWYFVLVVWVPTLLTVYVSPHA
jgi:heme/copper-type cytochrome/quinol oxidase subunit 3